MEKLYHPVSIGNLKLEGNLFLAPLAGYTDKVYRGMCLSRGANLAYTEMVSSEGVYRKSEKTVKLMDRAPNEDKLAVQIFMPDDDTAYRSIEGVLAYNPSIIDINCGCPVPKVTKTGAGSALLKNPEMIGRIVNTLVKNTGLPVTVKIRTGWDSSSINYLETAKQAFDNGASAVCMHARTKSQLYMPFADWTKLTDLKKHFPNNLIIGSGDLFSAGDCVKMLTDTGIDAVVFARGAIGNPFIFEQAKALLEGKDPIEINTKERITAIKEQLTGMSQYLGENVACREMRKHVCAYIKGIHNSSKVKAEVTQATTIEQYLESLSKLEKD